MRSPIPSRVVTAPAVLDRLSHDFYWYSPVLRPLLANKTGDVAVQPVNVEELLAVMRFAGATTSAGDRARRRHWQLRAVRSA